MKWLTHKLKGWRTIVANAVFAIVPVLELAEVRDVVPDDWLPWYSLFVVLANMYLRKITTTPVGKKG
jgi:hypothetical protein